MYTVKQYYGRCTIDHSKDKIEMFENICKLANIQMDKSDLDKIWPSLEKTLSLFDVLEEINTSDLSLSDLNVTGENQLRADKVTQNAPDNMDNFNHYDSESQGFITPKVIDE